MQINLNVDFQVASEAIKNDATRVGERGSKINNKT